MNNLEQLRITYICRYVPGVSEILKSICNGLEELGATVQELNLTGKIHLLFNPQRHLGGNGPVYVRVERLFHEIEAFQPHVVIFCGGGLMLLPQEMERLKKHCLVMGMTLSDPDVLPTVAKYAADFDYHTTNSLLALQKYEEKGIHNTLFMPFAADLQYFEPKESHPKFACDVAVIGHMRPDRLSLANKLISEFDVMLHGNNWPSHSNGVVRGEDWFHAAYSTKCLINFPRTGAGHTNVKVGVFEAAATGRLLFTGYFDEMKRYFEYDREIIGYLDEDDLITKLRYYLSHPEEADQIATAARLRCLNNHTWSKRLADVFEQMNWELLESRSWS